METGLLAALVRNTLVAICARIFLLVLSLVLTPYLLATLGREQYGIWVLVSTVVGYLGLLDPVLAPAFAKYIAEYDARNDRPGIDGVVSTGLLIYAVLAPMIFAVVYFSADVVMRVLSVSPSMHEVTRYLMYVGVVTFIAGLFTAVFQSVITGLQRMDIAVSISSILSGVTALGAVLVLHSGYGLRGLAINQLVIQVIGLAAMMYFAYVLAPGMSFNHRLVPRHFISMAKYGANINLTRLVLLINFDLNKLLVSRFLGPTHVTDYDIGSRVPAVARSFPVLLFDPVMPASSHLASQGQSVELYRLFAKAAKYVALIAFPAFTVSAVCAPLLVETWVGDGYHSAATVARVLSVGYLASTLVGVVTPVVQGMGRPDLQRNAEIVALGLNFLASSVFLARWGFHGAALGCTLAMLLSSLYYLWAYHRLADRELPRFIATTFVKPAVAAVVGTVFAIAAASLLKPHAPAGRLGGIFVLGITGTLFTVVYLATILKLHYLETIEFARLWQFLPFRKVLRGV